jgi:hypothetical protein
MDQSDLLRCLLQVIGRAAIKEEDVRDVIGSGKQLKAFNLCDGSLSQAQIARKAKIERGNFSRNVTRWVENGVLFRIGGGNDATLLHIYPIPPTAGGRSRGGRER